MRHRGSYGWGFPVPALQAGLSTWSDKSANNYPCDQELQVGWEATGSVPAVTPVKQLASVWAQKRHDVLEIRCRARRCSESRRIQRAACAGEEDEAEEAATDLEAARADVLMWQTIASEMKNRSEQNRGEPGAAHGTGCGTRRDMQRNNHVFQS